MKSSLGIFSIFFLEIFNTVQIFFAKIFVSRLKKFFFVTIICRSSLQMSVSKKIDYNVKTFWIDIANVCINDYLFNGHFPL